jgi:hypothetical protein
VNINKLRKYRPRWGGICAANVIESMNMVLSKSISTQATTRPDENYVNFICSVLGEHGGCAAGILASSV